jgi:AraC-like DNA-binding protein/mannose-6-phosphate isomerase-like protein (cupin superfamily)
MTQIIANRTMENRTLAKPPMALPDDLPADAGPVGAVARDYESGLVVQAHAHPWSQLIHAVSGVMRVTTPHGAWILPPNRALWVPPGVLHGLRMEGRVAMRSLFVAPGSLPDMPCKIVEVSGLLRELIQATVDGGDAARMAHIQALILDELGRLAAKPLHVPLPAEPRLRAVCDAILADPGRDETLDDWADSVGVSSRTLARLFRKEVGLRFVDWRAQARLAEALARLARGQPVSVVAHGLGYDSPAAFSAMFRRALGFTPRQCVG